MCDQVDDADYAEAVCSASCVYSCTRLHVGANCAVLPTIKAEIEAECGHTVELVPGPYERYAAEMAALNTRLAAMPTGGGSGEERPAVDTEASWPEQMNE